jgi:hypothetical protein
LIVYDYLGKPLLHKKIVPGGTATGLGSDFYTYTERVLAFTTGAHQIYPGAWIVGATSGAVAEVVSVTLTSGSWTGGNAVGTMEIKAQNGTFQSENLTVAGQTLSAAIAGNSHINQTVYTNQGLTAQSILVSVTSSTALALWEGGTPDQTSLIGHQMPANSSIVIQDSEAIKNFKVIDAVSGSACTVDVTVYF